MTGGPDPGLAADVSLGQPVAQLLLLFFVTLLIFFPHFSLLEFSYVPMCLKQLSSAPCLPCALPVHFLVLYFLVSLSFLLFFMFYRLGFLSLPCSASSVQTVAKPPNI